MTSLSITPTTAYLNLLRSTTSGANTNVFGYMAVGTSSAVPDVTDTKLGAEVFRKSVTAYTNGATGEIVIDDFISSSEAVGVDIEEIGIFVGKTATSALNSGVLYGRALFSRNTKTNRESIQIRLDLQYTAG